MQHIFFTTYAQIDLIFFSINSLSQLKIARSDHCSTDEKLQILFCLKLRTQESIFMKGKLAMPHLVWILVVAEFLSALHSLGYRSSNRPCLRTYNLKNVKRITIQQLPGFKHVISRSQGACYNHRLLARKWLPKLKKLEPCYGLPADDGSESFKQGMLTLILKGDILVRLTSLSLFVRNQLLQEMLGIFFSFSKQPSPNQQGRGSQRH